MNIPGYHPPQRARGQQRVDKLLDAAAEVFAEVGYEAATTNEIAAHAATAIGSLYQFFDDKEAILYLLAHRYLQWLEQGVEKVLAHTAGQPLPEVFIALADALREFYHLHPGFQPLFYGSYRSEQMAQVSQAIFAKIVMRMELILAERLPHMPTDERHACATVLVSVTRSQLIMVEQAEENLRPLLYNHARRMIGAYLATL